MTTIKIQTPEDAALARDTAIHLASHLKMPLREIQKIANAVSELASNIWRHALRGEITMNTHTHGIEILAEDEGPGLPEVDEMLRLGDFQGRTLLPEDIKHGGMGRGIGSICQLMDRVEFANLAPGGLSIHAWKWYPGGQS
jgi:serine/threonine-protein kinase RsbT